MNGYLALTVTCLVTFAGIVQPDAEAGEKDREPDLISHVLRPNVEGIKPGMNLPPGISVDSLRVEYFDREPPNWEGVNNRSAALPLQRVIQDFGYNSTAQHISKEPGEIGGTINPAAEPAYYAYRLPHAFNLETLLSASGKILVSQGAGHFLLGFFNSESLNEWRTANTLVARINGRGAHFHGHVEYCTSRWKAGAAVINRLTAEGKSEAQPIQGDRVYAWRLEYIPDAEKGTGRLTFSLDGQSASCTVEREHRAEGGAFTHFGLVPVLKSWDTPGEVWLKEVKINGAEFDFRVDPTWEGLGNRTNYFTQNVRPHFDFGWSPTHWAAGKDAGELGGLIFRGDCRYPERMAAYGDRLNTLDLSTPLYARGKLVMMRGVSDSTASIGFYHSKWSIHANPSQREATPMNYLGVNIEGPSAEGFFFYPIFRAHGEAAKSGAGTGPPRLHLYPDRSVHEWELVYDPNAGNGVVTLKLDGQACQLRLERSDRATGATFDRFGICTPWIDGNSVTAYFDDLRYTASPETRRAQSQESNQPKGKPPGQVRDR